MAPQFTRVVVDNASTDDTLLRVRERRGVHVIPNSENRGFAAAANQGIVTAFDHGTDADYILLLNPDVTILTSVDSLLEASRLYGLSAGKLVDQKGCAQAGFTIRRFPTPMSLIFELLGLNRMWPSNPVNRRYRCLDQDLERPAQVEQPAGAFLMFSRSVWNDLGGLDERFHPIWFEDVDFCRRAVAAGHRIQYLPEVAARHEGGHSIARIPAGRRAVYWCASLLRYASKHFRGAGYRAVCAAVVVGSLPRMVAGMIQERSIAPIAAYSSIVRFASLCLVSSKRRGEKEILSS